MNLYLIAVLAFLVGSYLLNVVTEWLNVRHISARLPDEFQGAYSAEQYARAQDYLRDSTRLEVLTASILTPLTVGFILAGGFEQVDLLARRFQFGEIGTGLIFAAILGLISLVVHLPFSWYDTFVLEERYGFNRTTVRTFLLDMLKGTVLGAVLGGIALAAVIAFFLFAGPWAWFWAWMAVTAYQCVLVFVAPVLIMPLFNKFTPLPEGELKTAIETYAAAQKFRMRGVFTMDGSKRSSKTNAFFTGFGRFRRIVLFDTLIQKHTVEELVAVLAHEMGHYRKGHMQTMLLVSFLTTGMLMGLLSLFIRNEGLFRAFGMSHVSVYASLVFFGFLYTPIGLILGIVVNGVSRRNEAEADRYAVATTHRPEAMVSALKKLSVDNLTNLTPHPFKVFMEYSHPPVLERIRKIEGAG